MATTPSIKVIKQMTYKGAPRLWSNRYHFNGGTPPDTAHWTTLSDAIVLAEKALYDTGQTIVETIGYAAGSDVPVFTKTYATVGTGGLGAPAIQTPGDVAALLRYSTTARTSKNHPVYLFNYMHGAYATSTTAHDDWAAGQKSVALAYANSWITGFSDGVTTYHRAGPNGATATGAIAVSWLTHRDFP